MTSKVNIILGLVVSTLLFIIAPLTAKAAESTGKYKVTADDFELTLNQPVNLLPDNSFIIEDETAGYTMTYSGTGVNRYSIISNGYDFLNGIVYIKTTFYYSSSLVFEDNFYFNVVPRVEKDGVDVFTYSFSRDTVNCTYTLIMGIEFQDVPPNAGYFIFDILYDINASAVFESGFSKVIGVTMQSAPTGSWSLVMNEYLYDSYSPLGRLTYYMRNYFLNVIDNLETIGDRINSVAAVNRQLWLSYYDGITSSISNLQTAVVNEVSELRNDTVTWLTNVRDTISSNFSTLFSNMQTHYNGMISNLTTWFDTLFDKMDNEHEEIINGYDSSTNNEAAGQLNDSMTQAMEKEDAVNQQANGYVDGYTINGDGVAGYATQFLTVFPLVSSMMQSIFDSSGAFGIIFSVIFTMTIVCMFIGMFRWYKS